MRAQVSRAASDQDTLLAYVGVMHRLVKLVRQFVDISAYFLLPGYAVGHGVR